MTRSLRHWTRPCRTEASTSMPSSYRSVAKFSVSARRVHRFVDEKKRKDQVDEDAGRHTCKASTAKRSTAVSGCFVPEASIRGGAKSGWSAPRSMRAPRQPSRTRKARAPRIRRTLIAFLLRKYCASIAAPLNRGPFHSCNAPSRIGVLLGALGACIPSISLTRPTG